VTRARYAVGVTTRRDEDESDHAGESSDWDDKPLEDQDEPEASTVDYCGGPNGSDDPAPDESPDGERA
jgi:hypothetical protein